jgi:diguanylate cyclase (GGDEF)-like protein
MLDSIDEDAALEHEAVLNLLYGCPVGLIEISGHGVIRLINPVAIKWLQPIAGIPFPTNFFALTENCAPEVRAMADAFDAAVGMVCENHRIFIGPDKASEEPKFLACTLVKLGTDRSIVTLIDVSASVAKEQRLKLAEAALREAEASLAMMHERERSDRALGIQARRFGTALDTMAQALCMFDATGGLIVANERVAEMLGMQPGSISLGVSFEALLARAPDATDLQQEDVDSLCGGFRQSMAAGRHAMHIHPLLDGRILAMNFAPMDGDGCLVTFEDITERSLAEARIIHMANHDALTGLPNRVKFHERLGEAVARSGRGETSAILYLDLDHFKIVNDTLGHSVGDALLIEVGKRLRQEIREIDTVARMGGAEFAIVQYGAMQPDDAVILAKRVIEVLSLPYAINGHDVTIGTSVGIVVIPDDGQDAHDLLRKADLALYGAKADGRGAYRFFETALQERMQVRRTLEIDLRKALGNGEFEVFYQPLMNISTRSVTGFEALLRWNHPERGLVPPIEFIPMAEEIGLIVPIGKWVLRQACADAATWPVHIKVAVNVSALQFTGLGGRALIGDVAGALESSSLDPKRLDLEITETVMLDDVEGTLATLHRLKDLGVGIAMDDFGTGYSSLNYLRRFPFTKVKIDRSFIETLGTGVECDAIVTAIAVLCTTLGMTTVAEGVETEDQLRHLRNGHCGEAQGYLFSRPRRAHEVADMCRSLTQGDPISAIA